MPNQLLKNKKGIIFGALDENSIAWKTAEKVHEQGGSFVLTNAPVAVQDFTPTAIKNQRYGGTKYGTVNGSIGGIINLVNDPTVTGAGLFDNTTTNNIKCAIEVVETNAIEMEVTERTINNRGDITLR